MRYERDNYKRQTFHFTILQHGRIIFYKELFHKCHLFSDIYAGIIGISDKLVYPLNEGDQLSGHLPQGCVPDLGYRKLSGWESVK